MSADARKARRLADKVERVTAWASAPRVEPGPMRIAFRLPWPPSVNSYWRSVNKGPLAGRVLISREGREYRETVAAEILRQRVPRMQLSGRLGVTLMACAPDRRARDLDNLLKGCFDSLTRASVIRDDSDFDDVRIWRGPNVTGGLLHVELVELSGPTESLALPLKPRPRAAEEVFS